jgi:hypothetical protein
MASSLTCFWLDDGEVKIKAQLSGKGAITIFLEKRERFFEPKS